MLQKEKARKVIPCDVCPKAHCLNRGNKKLAAFNFEHTCFEEAPCGNCDFFSFCQNEEKDTSAITTTDFVAPACFRKPTCRDCKIGSQCYNQFKIESAEFSFNPLDSFLPKCFKQKHSTR